MSEMVTGSVGQLGNSWCRVSITFAYTPIFGEKGGSYTTYQVQTIYSVMHATWDGKEKATVGVREWEPFSLHLCL